MALIACHSRPESIARLGLGDGRDGDELATLHH